MNCSDVQDILFGAETLDAGALPGDLASHLAGCAECAELHRKLQRLEAAALDLAPAPGADNARRTFLRQLGVIRAPRPRHNPLRLMISRSWRPLAAAAAVLLALAGAIWLLLPKPRASDFAVAPATQPSASVDSASVDTMLDQLVDANLALSDAESPQERQQIYADQFTPLQATLRTIRLAPDEGELANKLLETGAWLSMNPDPVDQTERFDNVASLMLDRLQNAAPGGNARQISRLSHRYAQVAAHLEGLKPTSEGKRLTPEQTRKFDNLLARQEELDKRLQALLNKTPEPSRKQISQEVESARKAHRKKHHKPK